MATRISLRQVTKRFPGVVALDGVSFDVAAGSCHALVGENGAGKSTLGGILAGVHRPDGGEVLIDGAPVRFDGPHEAMAHGIALVHQELVFCQNLTVAENLCLGQLPRRGGFLAAREMARRARAALDAIGADIAPDAPMGELPVGHRQQVQIAAAVSRGARILVFDEPTSSLSDTESRRLFDLIRNLRARGVTSIYVSHRMEEVFALCDTLTVLRDGAHVGTRPTAGLDPDALVEMMIGRPLAAYFPRHRQIRRGAELLRVERLSSPGRFADVSFELHAGEVLGFAGLVGSGRTQVLEAVFGLDRYATGRVLVDGKPVRLGCARGALALGIGLVPEDRQRHGLVPGMSVAANMTLPFLDTLSNAGFVRRRREAAVCRPFFERMRIKAPGLDTVVAALSGGNQQKIVMARWLAARCGILLVDEPTRGVDVGAKAEIHGLLDELACDGKGIILVSSELPELIHIASRVLVFREGRVAGTLAGEAIDQDRVLRLMTGL